MPFCISGSDSFWEPGNYKKTTRWVRYHYLRLHLGHPFILDFSLSLSFTNSLFVGLFPTPFSFSLWYFFSNYFYVCSLKGTVLSSEMDLAEIRLIR
jgi:hypothetical protein